MASYSELTLDTIDLSLLLRELVAVIRTHHLHIPPDLVLLIRSLVTIEGVGRNLDPHFDIAKQLAPFIRDLSLRRFRPDRILGQTVRTTEDLQRIATLLPDLLSQSLESIRRGELRVHFDLQGFERMVRNSPRQQQLDSRNRHRRLVRGIVPGVESWFRHARVCWIHDRPGTLPVAGLEYVDRLSGHKTAEST